MGQAGFTTNKVRAYMVIRTLSLQRLGVPSRIISLLENPIIAGIVNTFIPNVLEGVPIELSYFDTNYGINEIPTANAAIAVGHTTPGAISAIHYIINNLKAFFACSIYLTVESGATNAFPDLWPTRQIGKTVLPATFRVFDGFVVGAGSQKSIKGGAELRLFMLNWLNNLNFSSATSRSSSPTNPADLAFNATSADVPPQGALGIGNGNISQSAYVIQNFPVTTVLTDIWGSTKPAINKEPWVNPNSFGDASSSDNYADGVGGMKAMFTTLCKQDNINWRAFLFNNCISSASSNIADVLKRSPNVEALSAIRRFEPLNSGYADGVPLALRTFPNSTFLANSLAEYLSGTTYDNMANVTIWDKLVGTFSPQMQFMVIPQVEKALIVPFNPGLRQAHRVIYGDEYEILTRDDFIPRPIKAVGFWVGKASSTGVESGAVTGNPIYSTVGPYYENVDNPQGIVIMNKLAPQWLANVYIPQVLNPLGNILLGNRLSQASNAIANAFNVLGGALPVADTRLLYNSATNVWCAYAKSMYIQESLRGRNARLTGKLRFDICPGSILQIEDPFDTVVENALGKNWIFGMCQRVSIVVSTESASTSFQIGFVRNAQENADDNYSTTSHPLWTYNWYGSALVNHPVFN